MDVQGSLKLDTDALIEAIWGPETVQRPIPPDPEMRERQNQALAIAMKAYLQQYLAEL